MDNNALLYKIALHESAHAILVFHLDKYYVVKEVNISPSGGKTITYDIEANLFKKAKHMDNMTFSYAGKCIEELIYGNSEGCEDDLEIIERLAIQIALNVMDKEWSAYYRYDEEYQTPKVKRKVIRLKRRAEARSKRLVRRCKKEILLLADHLYKKHHIDIDEIYDILLG